jgi:rhodanese-related sulfurtransferase
MMPHLKDFRIIGGVQIFYLVVGAFVVSMLNIWSLPRNTKSKLVRSVSFAETLQWTHPVVWVDARQRRVFELEHIPNAVLLNEQEWVNLLPAFVEKWSPDRPVVVYCDSGDCDASQSVAARLKNEIGVEEAFVLAGGWRAWKERSQ